MFENLPHGTELPNESVPATGRHGENTSTIVMSRLVEGRWADDYVLIDMLGLLQKLGVIPMPGAVPA